METSISPINNGMFIALTSGRHSFQQPANKVFTVT